MIKTYIVETNDGELYCGRTIDIDKRLQQHKKEKRPHWFAFKNRKNFRLIYLIIGDFEIDIKRMGIRKFINLNSWYLRP